MEAKKQNHQRIYIQPSIDIVELLNESPVLSASGDPWEEVEG